MSILLSLMDYLREVSGTSVPLSHATEAVLVLPSANSQEFVKEIII